MESSVRHRNPLFRRELGLAPNRCLTVDTLHCMYLGVFLVWARVALWYAIDRGFFPADSTGAHDHAVSQLRSIRMQLWQFYRDHRATNGPILTDVSDLSAKMLGIGGKLRLKVKAAECWGVVLFLVDLYERFPSRRGQDGTCLMNAGRCLVRIKELMATRPWNDAAVQETTSVVGAFNRLNCNCLQLSINTTATAGFC